MEGEPLKSEIERNRERINAIDTAIQRLLVERAEVAKILGVLKGEEGRPIRDEQREAQVLEQWKETARENGLPEDKIAEVARAIIDLSRSIQE